MSAVGALGCDDPTLSLAFGLRTGPRQVTFTRGRVLLIDGGRVSTPHDDLRESERMCAVRQDNGSTTGVPQFVSTNLISSPSHFQMLPLLV